MSSSGGGGGGGGDRNGDAAGVYGKVPSQPDFLRANAGDFSQGGLDRWFQDAVEIIRVEKTALPPAPTAFLLVPSGSRSAFLGAFAPSADAAGREFPLSIFASVATAGLADALPALVSTCAPFVEAAAVLAATGSALGGPELVARVQDLPPPRPPGGGAATTAELGQVSAQPLVAALGGSRAALGYALRTFTMACDQAVKTGPAGQGGVITIGAPAPDGPARSLWLELARRRLKWREPAPSLLWTTADEPAGRMLLTLGWPAPTAMAYLANPRHRAPRFWPLRTEVGAAVDQAMKAITPEQRRLVENPGTTLAQLVSVFS